MVKERKERGKRLRHSHGSGWSQWCSFDSVLLGRRVREKRVLEKTMALRKGRAKGRTKGKMKGKGKGNSIRLTKGFPVGWLS